MGIDNDKIESPTPADQATATLHPRVYALAVGLVAWLVLSVWLFFSGPRSTDYLLAIVSGFMCIAVMLPFLLSRQRRPLQGDGQQPSFRVWRTWRFETWTGRMSGFEAAEEILLPIAVVAFGMTAFGIVLHLVELSST